MTVTWDQIAASEEYAEDVPVIRTALVNGIALQNDGLGEDGLYIDILTHLIAVLRYKIRHVPEQVDLDKTLFLDLIQKQIGVEIPYTSAIPIVEFLRETKRWYGGKGTEQLYNFIATVIGSLIEIRYPADLIFKWSSARSCWSGSTENNGHVSWSESKLARFRDGIYWANFVYVVRVLQAQNILNFNDFVNLIENIHPAGTQRFLELMFNYLTDRNIPTIDGGVFFQFFYWPRLNYPTWDNNWIWSGKYAKWSMHGGNIWNDYIDIRQTYSWERDHCIAYKTHEHDSLMHRFISNRKHTILSLQIENLATGGYDRVYSDTNSLIYDNARTNCGTSQYTYEELDTATLRELQHFAYNLDKQNPPTTWFYWLPRVSVILCNALEGQSVVGRVQQQGTVQVATDIWGQSIVSRVQQQGVLDVEGIAGSSFTPHTRSVGSANVEINGSGQSVVGKVQQQGSVSVGVAYITSIVGQVQQQGYLTFGPICRITSIVPHVRQVGRGDIEISLSGQSIVGRVSQSGAITQGS